MRVTPWRYGEKNETRKYIVKVLLVDNIENMITIRHTECRELIDKEFHCLKI